MRQSSFWGLCVKSISDYYRGLVLLVVLRGFSIFGSASLTKSSAREQPRWCHPSLSGGLQTSGRGSPQVQSAWAHAREGCIMKPDRLVVALCAVIWLVGSLRAQMDAGMISGSVKDVSYAIIRAARVTVVNLETRVTRVVEVNEQGFYAVPDLTPGTYSVSASAPGFTTVRDS